MKITDKLFLAETLKQSFSIQIYALQSILQNINVNNFINIAEKVYSSKGRLVVTGIGKSAIIAQKIVATMNSTGTQSIFMHAADAIHGDLGMIAPEDCVVCISKSGNTPEIKALVPLLKQLGNPLIAICSESEAYLSKNADFLIYMPIEREADPNNLAPTTSTTVQLVIGDALAILLLAMRGFTPKDFSKFHPGGTLGKQLYLTVGELSKQNEKPSVRLETPLQTVLIEISSKRLGASAVLDAEGNIVGIITDGDLRRLLQQNSNLQHLTAQEVMSPHPVTMDSDILAVEALQTMREKKISQLIVTQQDIYIGMVHLHDFVREGII